MRQLTPGVRSALRFDVFAAPKACSCASLSDTRPAGSTGGRSGGLPFVAGEDADPFFEVFALLAAGVGPPAVLAVACLDRGAAAGLVGQEDLGKERDPFDAARQLLRSHYGGLGGERGSDGLGLIRQPGRPG